jgi:hypothetical protein
MRIEGRRSCNLELPAKLLQHLFPRETTGEGGIRTLGTLLRYSALAKRRFRPLSHLTWICGGNAISAEHGASNETFGRQPAGQAVHGVRSPAARENFGSRKADQKPGPKIFLQLSSPLMCPAIEIQNIDMKNNIISFTPQEARQEIRRQGSWIRIESESAFGLIESLLVLWLGAWSVFAGIEFLQSTGILVF